MSESKIDPKTVKGPKHAVATFMSKKNGTRIYVYTRRGETRSQAIERVMSKHNAKGETYDYVG